MNTSSNNQYHINLFRGGTPYAKANSKLVIILVCIWAVAVFGFQIALKVFEKPTPEKNYTAFQSVWQSIESGTATIDQQKVFTISTIRLLGKTLENKDRIVISDALGFSISSFFPNSELELTISQLDLLPNSLEAKLLPLLLPKSGVGTLSAKVPDIFKKYSVHNQSFLTDSKIFGFPFHYWYTAEFLLILFVGICFYYCKRVVSLQKKFNVKDEL